MPSRLRDNPLQRNLDVKRKSYPERYLRRFFERNVIQEDLACCPRCFGPLFQERGADCVWCECGASYQLVQIDISDEDDDL